MANGFPPLADYRLSGKIAGATILALGPRPVYYVRTAHGFPSVYSPLRYEPSQASNFDRVLYVNSLFAVRDGPLYETNFTTVA